MRIHDLDRRLADAAFLAIAAMPVLPLRATTFCIALWTVATAVHALRHRQLKRPGALVLVLTAPFLLMLLDLPRSADLHAGWRIVERSSALLVFPVGLLLLGEGTTELTRRRAVGIHSGSTLALALYANLIILWDAGPLAFADPQVYRSAFANLTGLHPPFAAYHLVFAGVCQTVAAWSDPSFRRWQALAAGFLLASAAVLGSRMPLIAAVVALLLIVLRARTVPRWTVPAVAVLAALLFAVPNLWQRMGELGNTQDATTLAVRSPILHCGLSLIESHPLIGMGQAAVQTALDACYTEQGHSALADGSHSTHAQALHWWAAFGVAGLLAFIALFALPLRHAWQQGDAMHLGLLVIIGLCCLTENVLARQWGVVLFAYFNTLFLSPVRPAAQPDTY